MVFEAKLHTGTIRPMKEKEIHGRIPPQDLDAEKAVLGAIMLRPESMFEVDDVLSPDVFYSDRHKAIYKAMETLSSKGEPIDLLSISAKLKEDKSLERIGGATYLTEIVQSVPSSANIRYYADLIYHKFQLRNLITASDSISQLAYAEDGTDVEEVLDQAEKKIFSITGLIKNGKNFSFKDTLKETWAELEKLQENDGAMRGVPTGYHDLDMKLSGLQKSDLIILAARPSMGKTTLALDIARHAAVRENTPVVIFSLEMSSAQLVTRMLATEARVDAWKLRTGNLDDSDSFMRIRDALDRLSSAPIYIDDQAANTMNKMKSFARRIKSEHGLGLIVVDYLQLMATSKNHDSMVNQVTEISRSLKALARELEAPVLALSQLSRAVETRGGRPKLSDLRDSGSIEQDADIVMFIHRDEMDRQGGGNVDGMTQLIVAKHRNGPTGEVDVMFDSATTTFHSVAKNIDAPQYAKRGASLDEAFG
jgi:replicative DNA helicase